MAAPITNSNETPDSITEGLLIHEAPPSFEGLRFHMPSFFVSPWFLIYFVPPYYRPSDVIVIFKAGEHCFILEGFQSKPCLLS